MLQGIDSACLAKKSHDRSHKSQPCLESRTQTLCCKRQVKKPVEKEESKENHMIEGGKEDFADESWTINGRKDHSETRFCDTATSFYMVETRAPHSKVTIT